MLGITKYTPFVDNIVLSTNQETFLVNQVIDQLRKYYSGDTRKMVLEAFTGSGKTTVTMRRMIPEFIKEFYPQGKRAIGFVCSRDEVVRSAYTTAKDNLDATDINGAKVHVYHTDDLTSFKKSNLQLAGDVVLVFMTAQWFLKNYDTITANGTFDLVIADEAHIMFGTISWQDTKADKGALNKNFVAKTLDALSSLNSAVLFLTATPTNSQKTKTPLGATNNVKLNSMPRDELTTPFYDIVSYIDNQDTVFEGLKYFKDHCDKIGSIMKNIEPDTWNKIDKNFVPMYPACLLRLGQNGAKNGVDIVKNLNKIRSICNQYNFTLAVHTSTNGKEFDGFNTRNLQEIVNLGNMHNHKPIVLVVVESGTAGLDFVKINNVIIGREPQSTIHNNYSQTGGRAARMKFNFRNHHDAGTTIHNYMISEEQKRLVAEYYVLHSSSAVHVPIDSVVLNNDVKNFLESDTFREQEGRKFILNLVFTSGSQPNLLDCMKLVTSTTIQNDIYKKYKKSYCECCDITMANTKVTSCFESAFSNVRRFISRKVTIEEFFLLWEKCLQVHHKDGNHFNNDPDNLITLCPNVHALITMVNEDYNNRYPEIHEMVKKVASKKGVTAPKSLAFLVK